MSAVVALVGRMFGRLVVNKQVASTSRGRSQWSCKCWCGSTTIVTGTGLLSGKTRSCGCLRSDANAALRMTHGCAGTREYTVWAGMIQRCEDPAHNRYHRYGGRGIKVCARWRGSFENFSADMGPRPSPRHSIDRKNGDLDYSPDNCRWATPKEQALNNENTRLITIGAVTDSILGWGNRLSICDATIRWRLAHGQTERQALRLDAPPNRKKTKPKGTR